MSILLKAVLDDQVDRYIKKTIKFDEPEKDETIEVPKVEYKFCFTADFDEFESLDVRSLPSVSDARKFMHRTVLGVEFPVRHFGSPKQIRKGFHYTAKCHFNLPARGENFHFFSSMFVEASHGE